MSREGPYSIPHAAFYLYSQQSPAYPHIQNFEVPVDPDMVAIGGGVVGDVNPGKLLTASYPKADLSAWVVSAKDHMDPDPAPITGYAIGLQLTDPTGFTIDRLELLSFFHLTSVTSEVGHHVEAFAPTWPNCLLIGGGFQVHWSDPGSLATASFPDLDDSAFHGDGWRAKAKDHIQPSLACITSYAISLEQVIVFSDTAAYQVNRHGTPPRTSPVAGHPGSAAVLPQGYGLSGGGAEVQWEVTGGAGNLLWKLHPTLGSSTLQVLGIFSAGAKAHDIPDDCAIDTYAIGISFSP